MQLSDLLLAVISLPSGQIVVSVTVEYLAVMRAQDDLARFYPRN